MTRGAALGIALASLQLASPTVAHAQDDAPSPGARPQAEACGPVAAGGLPVRAGADAPGWPAPLDRVVATRREALSLQRALEQLAVVARVRFSYSPELLSLERAVCLPAGPLPLGDAIRAVLAGTELVPVVAGSNQVVLAPGRMMAGADAPPVLARTVGQLERVVVTGTATGAPERASPFALNVIEGPALERAGTQSVAQLLDGTVPGLWMWTQPPTTMTARFGSVRGASSFGVTAPKVYIDGIEVANPLLLAQLDATRVQRIEVIRGPQGAALYGADAISGVINVVTRRDDAAPGMPRAELRASAGAASSAYAPQGVLAQEHGLQLRAGVAARSAGLAASLTTVGAYVPGASSRHVLVSAGARRVGARLALSGTARWQDGAADVPASPLLDPVSSRILGTGTQRLRQYTAGGTATFQASDDWTHAFIAGVDGYALRGLTSDALLLPVSADSVLADGRGNGQRVTLRASATRRVAADGARRAAFTMGLEQTFARQFVDGLLQRTGARGGAGDSLVARATVMNGQTTGVLAQGQVSWRDALFVQGGARVEYAHGLAARTQVALLPMLGVAWVRDFGPAASLKLRGAAGRAIRPLRTLPMPGSSMHGYGSALVETIDPETQSGVEWGADLRWDAPLGTRVGLQATRFDQLASNLAQPVAVRRDSTCYRRRLGEGSRRSHDDTSCLQQQDGMGYELQNVGRIANDGWELQASVSRGALSLASSLALVDSRVQRVRPGYGGDLRVGDRMLEVPARTVGVSASWASARWTVATTVARASDWINYDRVGLAEAFAAAIVTADATKAPPVGRAQRTFWLRYDGVTRIGARLDVTLWRATALTVRGDNLLDRQVGEPDNVTVLPGRTVMLGVRTGF